MTANSIKIMKGKNNVGPRQPYIAARMVDKDHMKGFLELYEANKLYLFQNTDHIGPASLTLLIANGNGNIEYTASLENALYSIAKVKPELKPLLEPINLQDGESFNTVRAILLTKYLGLCLEREITYLHGETQPTKTLK